MAAEPATSRDAAFHILRVLREAGYVAYFAGGCVRDQLLGIPPKDYDVATSAPPEEVRRIFRNSQAVGAAFGVILVKYGGQQVEVATFRTDGVYSDGRRPDSVRFSTPEEDARRRDFTINGLFFDPMEDKVIDFVDGRADLEACVLRAIGDPQARLGEDYLRMLRAVRFAARFELTLDPGTAAAIRTHAGQLRLISPERVGEELRKILPPATRVEGWKLLRRLGLLVEVLRFVPAPDSRGVEIFPHLAPGEPVPFVLALAVGLLDDGLAPEVDVRTLLQKSAADPAVRGLRQALRLSNDESESLDAIFHWAGRLLTDEPPRLALKRRFLATTTAEEVVELLKALLRAGLHASRIAMLLPDLASLALNDNDPPPLLTGDDLTAAGLKPGPAFRTLLESTYDEQLEGRLITRQQAIAFALAKV